MSVEWFRGKLLKTVKETQNRDHDTENPRGEDFKSNPTCSIRTLIKHYTIELIVAVGLLSI